MLGQNNDPTEMGIVKIVLGTAFAAIGVMWVFFVRVFWAVFSRNEELRTANKKLRNRIDELEEQNDDDQ